MCALYTVCEGRRQIECLGEKWFWNPAISVVFPKQSQTVQDQQGHGNSQAAQGAWERWRIKSSDWQKSWC